MHHPPAILRRTILLIAIAITATLGCAAALTVTLAAPALADAPDRTDDHAPFSAGARIGVLGSGGVAGCTSGFGVHRSGGQTFLLTAGHCGSVGDAFSTYDTFDLGTGPLNAWQRDRVGSMVDKDHDQDLGLIQAPSSETVYDRDLAGNTILKHVVGVARPRPGDTVCVSGARTGVVCGVRIMQTDLHGEEFDFGTSTHPDRTVVPTVIWAQVPADKIGADEGDSGGPVFTIDPTQPDDVYAVGMVTGGQLSSDGKNKDLFFAPIDAYLTQFGVTLNTTPQGTDPISPPAGLAFASHPASSTGRA